MKSEKLSYTTILHAELQAVETLLLEVQTQFPSPIAATVVRLVNGGGKRLRPALTLLSAYMFGAEMEYVIPVASAVEMLHTATLIHDDLIDGAPVRRGIQTLNATWNPAVTVLAGDIVFAWAAKLATRSQNLRVVQRFSETLAIICNGELRQMLTDKRHLSTPTAYYERIFAKTASLFALSAEAGPLLAHQSEEDIARLSLFGKWLGEAFQIADDVLDFMGNEALLGKPVGNDLRQGIITLPILYYSQQHSDDTRIQTILHSPHDEATLQAFIADVRRSDAAEWAMQQAQERTARACALLTNYPDTPYRRAMEEIAAFAVQRQY